MSYQTELNTSQRILMGPGPSDVHPRVLKAMATPLIGHLDPEFVAVMDDIKAMAQLTFQTQNHLTFVVSAPGSAGMETCLVNLLEPGDECIICINGVFGGRMADIAERCGATALFSGERFTCGLPVRHGGNHEGGKRSWRPRSGDAQ